MDAQTAISQSIHQDRRVTVEGVTLEELRTLGLQDAARENDGSIDAWGTQRGQEWRLRLVLAAE